MAEGEEWHTVYQDSQGLKEGFLSAFIHLILIVWVQSFTQILSTVI